MASPLVIWDILRNNNSFLVRKDGVSFSSDPKNLKNIHSYKYHGLAQPKGVGVVLTPGKEGQKPAITLKRTTKKVNHPARATHAVRLSRGVKYATKSIKNATVDAYYRPDLQAAALQRYSQLKRSIGGVKKSRANAKKASGKR